MSPAAYYTTLAVAMVVLVPLLVSWQLSRRRALMRPLAAALDGGAGEMKGWWNWIRLEGQYRGRAAAFRQRAGDRYRSPRFEALLDCHASRSFRVGRERAGARLAKRLHLMKDVESGDRGLDRLFTFQSSDPGWLAAWLRSAEGVPDAIRTLMRDPSSHSLELSDSRLRCARQGWALWPDVEDARLLLEALRMLAESAERA